MSSKAYFQRDILIIEFGFKLNEKKNEFTLSFEGSSANWLDLHEYRLFPFPKFASDRRDL